MRNMKLGKVLEGVREELKREQMVSAGLKEEIEQMMKKMKSNNNT